MKIILEKVYKLSEDYQEIFINNSSETHVQYNEVRQSSRTIHQDHYENLYILEPHTLYKIEYKLKSNTQKNDNIQLIFDKKLIKAGLINGGIDIENNVAYFYNCGENNIMIQDKAELGIWVAHITLK